MSEQIQQPLNEREQEIVRLIADGLSNNQIAQRLSLSLNTVKWYLKHIYAVLEVKRRTQAVAAARSRGLLDGDSPPGVGLPIPPTPFIGRQKELAQVLELLDNAETRLVSIVGPGGIGKTRLALAAAAQFQANSQLPVYFVALEGIQQLEGVIPAIAGATGFQFGGQQNLHQQLLAGLNNRAMLLVLDNCEHVLEAISVVTDILAVAPNLKILTTSRERLNLRSETLFHLDGLTYPIQLQTIVEYDSINLFLQTVRRLRQDFIPEDGDLGHISRICELVEGMPLAIELAAGWSDVLSMEEIADYLQQDISFLKTSARDVPARHRSMTAVFEQSWQLMTEAEQNVFKKLSVFRGGFDRAGAEAVAGASPEVLKTLLAKSRITEVQPGRWKLHELLRQFTEEKLRVNQKEYIQTILAHCQYYGHLMRYYEKLLEKDLPAFNECVPQAYADFENILTGWHSAIHTPFVREIENYLGVFSLLLAQRGLHLMAKQMFDNVDHLYQTSLCKVPILSRVLVFTYRGWYASALSELDEARQLLERADQLSVHPDVRDSPQLGLLWCFLGWTHYLNGELSPARHYFKLSLDHCIKVKFAFGEWSMLVFYAIVELRDSNYEVADQFVNRATKVAKDSNYVNGILVTCAIRGNIRHLLGQYRSAYDFWEQALVFYPRTLQVDAVLLVMVGLSLILKQIGQDEVGLDTLALVIHNPQCQASSYQQALHVLDQFRDRFSEEYINAVLERAKRGQLSTPYFESNFVIDQALVNRLLMLLNEFAPVAEE